MKNLQRISLLFIMGFCAVIARAIPANPVPVNVSQPDGETLTIVLHGDEFYHFTTTCDGFTLMKNNGGWEYAEKQAGSLVPSGVLAHNPSQRTAHELQLMKSLETNMIDDQGVGVGRRARSSRDRKSVSHEPVMDYGSFRGLVVLIEFNDKPFGMANPQSFYNDMVNTRNYTGFQWKNQSGQSVFQSCTGSARDYFYDQSMGHFDPQFDVVGPVKVPFSCHDAKNMSTVIFLEALEMIDSSVNFARYDSDHNGEIDMVFFQVSGYTSNYSGNNEDYLWPHMSFLYEYDDNTGYSIPHFDGLAIGRYACSGEIYGWESEGSTLPNGIGTICHEFTHVLGLPDLYDTDYPGSGGQSKDPAGWDVMATGSYSNYGRTPVGYSLWERAELGWATPVALTEGSRTLNPIHSAITGYVLEAPGGEETFFFENRQQVKWDASLPGHGLLVARVDHSNLEAWETNTVNVNPAHNYYELVRAGSNEQDATFPGTTGKTQLNATSNPRLATWAGIVCDLGLENIAETNGVISFTVAQGPAASQMVEDFETMPLSPDNMQTGVQGRFAKWDFVQADVAAVELFESSKSCVMGMPASITMTNNVYADIYTLTVEAMNPSTTEAKLQLSYSFDKGATWTALGTQTVAGGDKTKLIWRVNLSQPVRFRLNRTAGDKTQPLYVDNFTINYTGRDKCLFKHNGLWYRDSDVGNDVSNVTLVAPQQGENYTGKVIIPDAFNYNGQTKVVQQIDANAFTGTAVTSVEVPTAVTSIGKEAFYGAKSLESLVLATDKAPRKFTLVGDDFAGDNASNFNCYVANNNLASWLETYYQISFLPWVKTGSDGYLTFASVRRVALPDGLTAYRVTGFNASQRMATTMMTDNRIPAKNGVILKGNPETRYLMQTTIQAPAIGDNMLLPLLTINDIPYAPFAAHPDDTKVYFLASSGKWHEFANNVDLFMVLNTGVAYLAVPKTLLGSDYTSDVQLDLWASGTRGDLNGDGQVDVTDVSIVIDIVLGKNNPNLLPTAQPDLDGNGFVDVTDVSLLIDIVLGK